MAYASFDRQNPLKDKIKRLYNNYGIDISDMEEEEYTRIINSYSNNRKKLEEDLGKSEEIKGMFTEDDII